MKRIKKLERKLKHNCPTCQATYTLLETHLARKDNPTCQANCLQVWETLLLKHCQEKVLGSEIADHSQKISDYE